MRPGARRTMSRSHVQKIDIEHIDALSLLGQGDQNLRRIEDRYPVQITLRDATLSVAGGEEAAVNGAASALRELLHVAERGKMVEDADVNIALGLTDHTLSGEAANDARGGKRRRTPRARRSARARSRSRLGRGFRPVPRDPGDHRGGPERPDGPVKESPAGP